MKPAHLLLALVTLLVSTLALAADAPAATTSATPQGSAAPKAEVQISDVEVGSGKEAAAGKAVLVWYTGWLYDAKAPEGKGKKFDSTENRQTPFGFIIGVGKVIKGWDQGVPGMKVGGKRRLVIPASLAYGEKGAGDGLIPPNATLLFEIELSDVLN
jgi:FKBP-type peptidyl-prolyl cis-trans isomerase FkpA